MSGAVPSFYDRWTPLYDVVASAPPVIRWRRRAIDQLGLETGDTVVDMGCGSGANLAFLRAAVGREGTVVGVDIAPGMLAYARRRVQRAGWENVHVVRASGTCPPLRADAVFGSFVVGMFDDPGSVVADWCASCLRPGGRLGLLDVLAGDHWSSPLLDPCLRAFVGLTTPTKSLTDRLAWTLTGDPLVHLTDAIEAGHGEVRALDSSEAAVYAGGYVRVTTGTVPAGEPRE